MNSIHLQRLKNSYIYHMRVCVPSFSFYHLSCKRIICMRNLICSCSCIVQRIYNKQVYKRKGAIINKYKNSYVRRLTWDHKCLEVKKKKKIKKCEAKQDMYSLFICISDRLNVVKCKKKHVYAISWLFWKSKTWTKNGMMGKKNVKMNTHNEWYWSQPARRIVCFFFTFLFVCYWNLEIVWSKMRYIKMRNHFGTTKHLLYSQIKIITVKINLPLTITHLFLFFL